MPHFAFLLLTVTFLPFGTMPIQNSNDQNERENIRHLWENENPFGPGIFQRQLFDSLMHRKKNIFRERWANGGERKMGDPTERAEILGEELAGGERHRKIFHREEEENGRKPKDGDGGVRFLLKEGDNAAAQSNDGGEGPNTFNPFEHTKFDRRFPIHNLCGPWNSGRQTSDFEWGEPADKLLRLLNKRANDGKRGRDNFNFKYNMFLAPGQMTGHSTNVSIAIYIESMSTFKAQTMDFEVDMYFAMAWYDRRLAHNCTHPLLIAHKSIAERIWTPDLYFLNAKFAYLQEVTMPNFMLVIYPDGLVFKTLRIDVTLSCNMDLQLFPFDRQECPIVIQPFAYIENLVNLSWHVDPPVYPITTNPELKLSDMVITGMRFERCTSPYTLFRGTGVWSCLRGYIVMKRLVLFHLIQTYIPSAMLVSVSWMTFWLDPRASPARITLTITRLSSLSTAFFALKTADFLSLLTLTTMSNGARQDLPQVSYIKAMDIWQTFSQALIFLVLLEYSFVSYFFTRRSFDCAHRSLNGRRAIKQNDGTMTKEEHRTEEGEERGHSWQNETKRTEMNNNTNAPIRKRTPKSAISATIPPNNKKGTFPTEFGKPTEGKRRFLCRMDNIREEMMAAMGRNHSEEGILMGLGLMEGEEEGMAMPTMKMRGQWEGNGDGGDDEGGEEEEGTDGGGREERRATRGRSSSRGKGRRVTHCQRCQWKDEKRGRAIDRYSRALFPTIFFSFCAAYWIYYGWLMADK